MRCEIAYDSDDNGAQGRPPHPMDGQFFKGVLDPIDRTRYEGCDYTNESPQEYIYGKGPYWKE